MFTWDAQKVVDRAKGIAVSSRHSQLTLSALATSIVMDPRGLEFAARGLECDPKDLLKRFPVPRHY